MMTMDVLKCKNCGEDFEGNFCNHCGQKKFASKVNFKIFSSWIIDAFDYHSGLINTFLHLQTKPGVLVHDFLAGKTKSYFNPVTYLLISFSLAIILAVTDTGWYVIFGLILFFTILYNSLIFRANKYNLFESIVISIFLVSQLILFWFVGSFVEKFQADYPLWAPYLIVTFCGYTTFFNWQVFDKEKKVINVLKSFTYFPMLVGFVALVMWLDKNGYLSIISTIRGLFGS